MTLRKAYGQESGSFILHVAFWSLQRRAFASEPGSLHVCQAANERGRDLGETCGLPKPGGSATSEMGKK